MTGKGRFGTTWHRTTATNDSSRQSLMRLAIKTESSIPQRYSPFLLFCLSFFFLFMFSHICIFLAAEDTDRPRKYLVGFVLCSISGRRCRCVDESWYFLFVFYFLFFEEKINCDSHCDADKAESKDSNHSSTSSSSKKSTPTPSPSTTSKKIVSSTEDGGEGDDDDDDDDAAEASGSPSSSKKKKKKKANKKK